MPKMHYFSNKFSKIARRLGAFRPQRSLTILVTWSSVIWPNCGFSSWLWLI